MWCEICLHDENYECNKSQVRKSNVAIVSAVNGLESICGLPYLWGEPTLSTGATMMGLHSALRPLWWAYTQHWGHYDGPNAHVCYAWDRSQKRWCKTSAIISAGNAVSVKRWQRRLGGQCCALLLIADLGRVSCLTSGVQGRDIWHLLQDGQRYACLLPGVSWHCWPVGRGLVSSF